MELRVWDDFWIGRNSADRADCEVKLVQHSCSSVSSLTDGKREEGFLFFFQFLDKWSCLGEMICEWRLAKIHWTGQTLRWSLCSVLYLPVYLSCWAGTGMAQQTGMGVNHQDTLAVPPMPKHSGLNEDLVKIDPAGEPAATRETTRTPALALDHLPAPVPSQLTKTAPPHAAQQQHPQTEALHCGAHMVRPGKIMSCQCGLALYMTVFVLL